MERIYKYIEKYGLLNMNDTVLAAVSGGADSMLLLRALVDLRSQYKLNLAVIHINHSLRGEVQLLTLILSPKCARHGRCLAV